MDTFVVNGVDFRPPVLPDGVAQCEGFGRSSWVSKRVTLLNEAGNDVATAVCQSVDSHVVPETGGRPLGSDFFCVQIAESLDEGEIPFGWIYSLRAWPIKRVMLNGASLYDHDQRAIYNAAVKAFSRPARNGVRQYDTTRQRRPRDSPPKKEYFLSAESINYVATTTCCSKNCVQPFPRGKIKDLRTQFYVTGDVFFRKHRMLDVHGQVHEDADGNDMITLDDTDVCCTA